MCIPKIHILLHIIAQVYLHKLFIISFLFPAKGFIFQFGFSMVHCD